MTGFALDLLNYTTDAGILVTGANSSFDIKFFCTSGTFDMYYIKMESLEGVALSTLSQATGNSYIAELKPYVID